MTKLQNEKYPRIGQVVKQGKWSKRTGFIPRVIGKCAICSEDATYYAHVQVSIFRGDDEVLKICHTCKKTRINELLNKEKPF